MKKKRRIRNLSMHKEREIEIQRRKRTAAHVTSKRKINS